MPTVKCPSPGDFEKGMTGDTALHPASRDAGGRRIRCLCARLHIDLCPIHSTFEQPEFTKHDSGKLQWSRFCWAAAAKVMRVMHYGADKYGWDNWRKAETPKDRRRYLDAAYRHMIDYADGEVLDLESGNPHLWHAACSLMFYLEYDEHVPKKKNLGDYGDIRIEKCI